MARRAEGAREHVSARTHVRERSSAEGNDRIGRQVGR